MGKASRRKQGPETSQSGDVHDRIQSEAAWAREASALGFCEADTMPAVSGLMEAASIAAGNATPTKFVYEGRPYWLRMSVGMALLEVFDNPGTARPLARSLTGSTDRFGHVPGH